MKKINKPMKVRAFIALMEAQGYSTRGGKGNHKILTHISLPKLVISGNPGDEKSPGFLNSLLRGSFANRNLQT